MSLVVKYLNPD